MSNRRSVASCIVCSCQLLLIVVSTAYGFTAASRHVTIQGAAHHIIRSQKSRIQGWWGGQDNSDAPTTPSLEQQSEEEISALEREVLYSTQAELDRRSVNRAVTNALLDPSTKAETTAVQGSKWSIALAGGLSMGSIVFVLVGGAGFSGTQSILVGILASLGIGFVASRNPLEEEDSAGAVARTVGRYTLKSVEAVKPKAKAIARAAIVGDEEILVLREQLDDLQQRNRSLENENTRLAMWKKRRIWVDDKLSSFNLSDLKDQARENKLQVGGTKAQLLMRLVEAEAINPTWDN